MVRFFGIGSGRFARGSPPRTRNTCCGHRPDDGGLFGCLSVRRLLRTAGVSEAATGHDQGTGPGNTPPGAPLDLLSFRERPINGARTAVWAAPCPREQRRAVNAVHLWPSERPFGCLGQTRSHAVSLRLAKAGVLRAPRAPRGAPPRKEDGLINTRKETSGTTASVLTRTCSRRVTLVFDGPRRGGTAGCIWHRRGSISVPRKRGRSNTNACRCRTINYHIGCRKRADT